ncbi:MAG: ATP-dependent RNA helicase HrpA, partial [Candidatus Aminicenantes bacterium]|nr:ATP-dependent RNA helicase HrpA [Candidatus Aminicenantes bacterium]
SFPEELPITSKSRDIIRAIKENQVVIISGETGCGKSTQIPKMCIKAGLGTYGQIACTQPRRIAATTIAKRIAEEMGENLGRSVGYKIRFKDRTPHSAYIKILTDGMLLAETQADPLLYEYDTLIIDEAHERSLNIDFLLGIARSLLVSRPELKLIITSATLDTEKFSRAFNNAPVIEAGGKLYPVEVEYRSPGGGTEKAEDQDYVTEAVKAVHSLRLQQPPGDILIFMPTEQDILETCRKLEGRKYPAVTVLPLFARLPGTRQGRVYSVKGPKIVVATNVAETSLTIPGIKYVIDTGLARISRYLAGTRINSLPISPISQASADQRKGRCGRLKAGYCIRLYSEDDFSSRTRFTIPEILRSNLAEVILRMTAMQLGHPASFPFLDRPIPKHIQDGYDTLLELGALERKGRDYRLTSKGRLMARMPLDPRISRMLIEARNEGCLHEVAIIASALSTRDPRERPPEKESQADQMHAPFKDPDSDFITLLNIWNKYNSKWEKLTTQSKKRRFCKEQFLSFPRMREWAYIHEQVMMIMTELRISVGSEEAKKKPKIFYAGIHRSILSGYLSNIAVNKQNKIYTAPKDREAMIFPGSTLFNKTPPWIVAAEMVLTSRLFARTVAKIDVSWLESLGGDQCIYSHSNPRWDKKRGEVVAEEQVTLFGLKIVSGRPVSYRSINPKSSHIIFIRCALIEGETRHPIEFIKHNRDLVKRLAVMENKLRRRDILVGEETVEEFYSNRLEGISDIRSLERKIKLSGGDDFLKMSEKQLLRSLPGKEELALFPDEVEVGDMRVKASYTFAPGEEKDGVTLKIPARRIAEVPEESLDWSIPGFFRERITALIKGLPKRYRKQLVPAAEKADIIAEEIKRSDRALPNALTDFIRKRFQVKIPASEWAQVDIPRHLKMRLALTDALGKELKA